MSWPVTTRTPLWLQWEGSTLPPRPNCGRKLFGSLSGTAFARFNVDANVTLMPLLDSPWWTLLLTSYSSLQVLVWHFAPCQSSGRSRMRCCVNKTQSLWTFWWERSSFWPLWRLELFNLRFWWLMIRYWSAKLRISSGTLADLERTSVPRFFLSFLAMIRMTKRGHMSWILMAGWGTWMHVLCGCLFFYKIHVLLYWCISDRRFIPLLCTNLQWVSLMFFGLQTLKTKSSWLSSMMVQWPWDLPHLERPCLPTRSMRYWNLFDEFVFKKLEKPNFSSLQTNIKGRCHFSKNGQVLAFSNDIEETCVFVLTRDDSSFSDSPSKLSHPAKVQTMAWSPKQGSTTKI